MEKSLAVAYLRTSSAANVGPDKDSHVRQLEAVHAFAKRSGCVIELPPFYDAAVSGADPIDERPGFKTMLAYLAVHPSVKTILVETASRFARDLVIQETGYHMLKGLGVNLIAVDSPDSFIADGPTAVLIRQILGAVSQFDKTTTVLKLRAARNRKRERDGKCEGRKSHAEVSPNAVKLARKLYRKDRITHKRRSFRAISAAMAEKGHLAASGKAYGPSAVKSMLGA